MAGNTGSFSRAIKLEEWRERVAGFSQDEVAALTGLSARDVARLELAPHQAALGALRSLVEACDGTLEVVLHCGPHAHALVF
jgi:hypothetical protein